MRIFLPATCMIPTGACIRSELHELTYILYSKVSRLSQPLNKPNGCSTDHGNTCNQVIIFLVINTVLPIMCKLATKFVIIWCSGQRLAWGQTDLKSDLQQSTFGVGHTHKHTHTEDCHQVKEKGGRGWKLACILLCTP